jgi:hypothetical protein
MLSTFKENTRIRGTFLATLILVACVQTAFASWCTEPSKPWCLDVGQPDSYCRYEVEAYVTKERDFRSCIVDEANTKIEESKTRVNKVVDRWNCYARGEKFCF